MKMRNTLAATLTVLATVFSFVARSAEPSDIIEFELCEPKEFKGGYGSVVELDRKGKDVFGYYCFLALQGEHRAQKQLASKYLRLAENTNSYYVNAYVWATLSNLGAPRASKERLIMLSGSQLEPKVQVVSQGVVDSLYADIGTGIVIQDMKKNIRSRYKKPLAGTHIPGTVPSRLKSTSNPDETK